MIEMGCSGAENRRLRALAVGHLHVNKGFELLFEALAAVARYGFFFAQVAA
jgi:hypothetical protein